MIDIIRQLGTVSGVETFLIIITLLVVVIALCVISALLYVVISQLPVSERVQHETVIEEKDTYTPDSADKTVPLDQFNPSNKKPLRMVIREEDDQTIMEEKDEV